MLTGQKLTEILGTYIPPWRRSQLLERINNRLDRQSQAGPDLSQYRDDPVRFGREVLGEIYTEDVKMLMRSVQDNMITIAKSANGTGKTHCAARVAVWWYLSRPGAQVYTAAAPPVTNLERLLWGEIGAIRERNPDLFAGHQVKHLEIRKSALEFLVGLTIPSSGTEAQREAKFSGKHAPYLLFILDEADAIPDEVYRGIEACMSGGHVRLLCMFNPRSEAGAPYLMERDGRANIVHLSAFSHPNVVSGVDQIPGAVNRETTVRRINQWTRRLQPGEPEDGDLFDLPEYLDGAVASNPGGGEYPPLQVGRYKIIVPSFSYMVLGRYPGQAETQLIAREWIYRAVQRWEAWVQLHGEIPPPNVPAIAGMDVAEYGVDSNCLILRYGGYVGQPITWSGMDVMASADRAAMEIRRRRVAYTNVDATGVGAGTAPALERQGLTAYGIKIAAAPTLQSELGEFRILRDQLWWRVREWLKADPTAMLPPDEELLEELRTPTYEIEGGKVRVMRKVDIKELIKRSPDKADALCLTFAEREAVYDPLDLDRCLI